MTDYITRESKFEKYMFWLLIVPAMGLLFVALSQPAWNGNHLISQFKSDCEARHGVQIVHHGFLGDTYKCESWLDK